MNITPVNFTSLRFQKSFAKPSFTSETESGGEFHPKSGFQDSVNHEKSADSEFIADEFNNPENSKGPVSSVKQYVKPFLAGVILTFAAQALYNNNEKSELKQQIYTERAIANSGVREMVKSIADDLKDIEKVDSVEMKNVMGGFSKELIINKDGQRIIYDADAKARYEDLGGDHYARTRFGVVME